MGTAEEESDISITCANCFTVHAVKYLTDHMEKQIADHYMGGRRGTAGGCRRNEYVAKQRDGVNRRGCRQRPGTHSQTKFRLVIGAGPGEGWRKSETEFIPCLFPQSFPGRGCVSPR